MIYIYKCPNCNQVQEIEHPMSECDNPSEATQLATSCNENTCHDIENSCLGLAWNRIPQAVGIKITGDWKKPENRAKFKQHAQQRSLEHFRESTYDKLEPNEKAYHKDMNPDNKLFK